MMKKFTILLLPALLVSCSVQDPYGANHSQSKIKAKTITLAELKDKKRSTYVKCSCHVSGLYEKKNPAQLQLGRFRSMQAPSVLMKLNQKEPDTVMVIQEHVIPSDPKHLPITGMTYSISSKLDEKTGDLIHSGKAMVTVRNPDAKGVISFSKGFAFWGEERSVKKDVTVNVKGHNVTFHFTFQLIDPTGMPLKVVAQ